MVKRIRVFPPGLPEPKPLKMLRQRLGVPEVYLEVPNEITLKPKDIILPLH